VLSAFVRLFSAINLVLVSIHDKICASAVDKIKVSFTGIFDNRVRKVCTPFCAVSIVNCGCKGVHCIIGCCVVLSVSMMEMPKDDENTLPASYYDDYDNKSNTLSACLFVIAPIDTDTAMDVVRDDVRFDSVSLPV